MFINRAAFPGSFTFISCTCVSSYIVSRKLHRYGSSPSAILRKKTNTSTTIKMLMIVTAVVVCLIILA